MAIVFHRYEGTDGQLIVHDGHVWVTRENLPPQTVFKYSRDPRRAPLQSIDLLWVFRGSTARPGCVHVLARGDSERLDCETGRCDGPGGVRFPMGAHAVDGLIESFANLGIAVRDVRARTSRPPRAGITVQSKDSQRSSGGIGSGQDGIGWYLERAGRVDLLTAEQEVDLAQRIEVGLYASELLRAAEDRVAVIPKREAGDLRWLARDGARARNHMIEANLRLVVHTARAYEHRGLDLLELIQEGNLGLIRAVEKFDYMQGTKFSTYATWWIRQSITRSIADLARSVRLPVHVVEDVDKLWRLRREWFLREGREAPDAEMAAAMDVGVDKIRMLDVSSQPVVSLDRITALESDDMLAADAVEIVDPFEAAYRGQLRTHIEEAFDTLSDREAAVLALRHGYVGDSEGSWRGLPAGTMTGESATLDEIGRIFGVTRERIRQIESKTMKWLREEEGAAGVLWAHLDFLD
ncbi:hypothetical protein GCM10023094_24720 [Rhodococcus olei]|uniref:RNA polymerase sigma factor n=1 Tax=Rhodococcus olei TaxID=2161675 RepID=A0ABP8P3D1_9NOCA